MNSWAQGFCIGAIVTTISAILVCVYSAIYLSGTISQAEEKEQLNLYHNLDTADYKRNV